MWRAIYPEAYILKTIFSVLSKIVDDVLIEVSEEALVLRRIDNARAAYVQVDFPVSEFNIWQFEANYTVGASTSMLMKVFKNAKRYDYVELMIDNDELSIALYNPQYRTDARRFVIKLFNADETFQIKELSNDVRVDFAPPRLYIDIIKGANSIGAEKLKIIANAEARTIRFLAQTEEGEKYEYLLDLEKSWYVTLYEIRNDAESEYSLEYLNKVTNIAKIAKAATIEFSKKMPLILNFMISQIRFQYVVAPRLL